MSLREYHYNDDTEVTLSENSELRPAVQTTQRPWLKSTLLQSSQRSKQAASLQVSSYVVPLLLLRLGHQPSDRPRSAPLQSTLLADRFGRKWPLVGAGVITSIGVALQAGSTGHLTIMYIGRLFSGFGVGAASMLTPLYVSECAPRAIRGGLTGESSVVVDQS